MWSPRTKKIALAVALFAILGGAIVARHFFGGLDGSARAQFLRLVPADATSVVFVDFDQLRASPFLAKLYAWAPRPAQDSEYAQFVQETGFDYERDLSKLFIAVSNHAGASRTVALAEGKFDRDKIEAFLKRYATAAERGSLRVYTLSAKASDKPLFVALLARQRVAISNSENLFSEMSTAVHQPEHSEWQTRFDRLAGAPVFAVIRQDAALHAAVSSAGPGGFRSPQLAGLLDQLRWISVAGKPDGDLLRIVAEGECSSELVASQLRDVLQGIQLLAQNGLNDPKLRQQMNPEQREAYLELLKSADVQKLDRSEGKSVRLVVTITPQFLAVAQLPQSGAKDSAASDPAERSPGKPAASKAKPSKKK